MVSLTSAAINDGVFQREDWVPLCVSGASSWFRIFPPLSVKICFMAYVTQRPMLKSPDVFWKCDRSNFQPMSQEICMFLWIKIKMKAGCVGRPGSDRIVPGCFLGWREIAKWGFLTKLVWILISGFWQEAGRGHCQLPCWVMCMFCTPVKLMIGLQWENKSQ